MRVDQNPRVWCGQVLVSAIFILKSEFCMLGDACEARRATRSVGFAGQRRDGSNPKFSDLAKMINMMNNCWESIATLELTQMMNSMKQLLI